MNGKLKKCWGCKVNKAIGEFGKDKSSKDGRSGYCLECARVKSEEYRKDHLDKARAASAKSARKARVDNPEKFREADKKSYNKNIEKRRAKSRNYYWSHLDECRRNSCRLQKFYRHNPDYPTFNIKSCLRRRLADCFRGKASTKMARELLGCTLEELKLHLESKFQPGMNWSNRGQHGWHIDHIRPCSSFDLTELEQRRQCFHYTNLQPLWAKDNLSKHARYE